MRVRVIMIPQRKEYKCRAKVAAGFVSGYVARESSLVYLDERL